MRVRVTPKTILEYGLDTLTGNTAEALLESAAKMEADGYEMFVNIPDTIGGDTEAPKERNVFKHYKSEELPDPEGPTHASSGFDLSNQAYVQNLCKYNYTLIGNGEHRWICEVHELPSKHKIDPENPSTMNLPCIALDPVEDPFG